MATYNYNQFRKVFRKLGFNKIRSKKHETWRKVLPDGTILRVRVRHKGSEAIPKWLFREMLRQAGIDEKSLENCYSVKLKSNILDKEKKCPIKIYCMK